MYGYVKDVNKEVDVLGLDIMDDAWKVVKSHMNDSGQTILGHFPRKDLGETFASYVDKAKKRGASFFDIGDMWNDVAKVTDPWVLNQRFLDVIIEKGDKIILNVKRTSIRRGSYLEKEIAYLEMNGYKWMNQWSLKKACK